MIEAIGRLTYLSFEINNECPLESVHPQCPRNIKDRYALSPSGDSITVDDIVGFYLYCSVHHGFRGRINLHNYNEPLATPGRIIEIMQRLPGANFSMWTNGVLLEETPECIWIIEHCAEVMVTKYPQTNIRALNSLGAKFNQIKTQPGILDNRADEKVTPRYQPHLSCGRPNFDFLIDYYGNGHMCCGDWRGEIILGNIKIDNYGDILLRWEESRAMLMRPMTEEVYRELPKVCKMCLVRMSIFT